MTAENSGEGLKRIVGVPGLALTVFNFSIGVGIYALPAIIGIQLGVAGFIGYTVCGLMFAAIMLCYVEIGSRIKTSGGSYAYVEAAFGPFAGFIVNWLFFFGWGILSDAAVMNVVADSLTVLFPVFLDPVMRIILFAVLIGLMILINVINTKLSVRFVEIITVVKMLPLLAIIIFGFIHIDSANLRWDHMPSLKTFSDTSLLLFFAFAGFETSLNVSGEIKNPRRTVPLGILFGGILVFVIYILIQAVTIGVLGSQMSEFRDAPLAAVAERIIGPAGITILLLAAAFSGYSAVLGDVLCSSRLLFAGSKDRLFPKFLGRIHYKFGTPHWAVIVYGGLIFIFSVSGGFKQLAVLASGALMLIYLAVILALIKIRMNREAEVEKSFKVPGGLFIPFIAIAAIFWVLSNLNNTEIVSIVVFVIVVSIIYFVMKRFRTT